MRDGAGGLREGGGLVAANIGWKVSMTQPFQPYNLSTMNML